MRVLTTILLFSAISACSFIDESHYHVDPRLKRSVDLFLSEAEKRGFTVYTDGLHIVVGDIESTGLYQKGKSISIITVNEATLKATDQSGLDYIIFHEMGHHIGRDHNDEYSIMNPNKYVGDFRMNPEKKEILIDELFREN